MADRSEAENHSEADAKGTADPAHVFISYASADTAVASALVEDLERHGIACWIAPRDVDAGALYADAIVRAITAAKAFVLLLSENSIDSSHVGKEIERASSKRRPIFALRIDAAPLTPALEYFLSESQWVDARSEKMELAHAKLIGAILKSFPAASGRITPVIPSAGATPARHPGRRRKPMLLAAVLVIVVLALAGLLVSRIWLGKQIPVRPETVAATKVVSDKSIAVLPFTDMSEKKDQEYFADGMTEEIINMLSKAPDLRVPARTSSFYFKGKSARLSDIARELGVANVLEGSVRRSGNQLRVTAQLIRADTGYHVWSETYDRHLSDVFKVQDDIANAVAQTLQISLMGGPLTRQQGGTHNLEAYLLYLRADKALADFSASPIGEARKNIEQAIKLDPDFILAWTMLGWIDTNLAQLRELPIEEGYGQARQLAQHALQVNPDLADAHLLLGYIHRTYDWDWAAAQSEARRGLALDPRYWFALELNGQISASVGKWNDAEGYLRKVLAVDPLNSQTHWDLGRALYGAGRFAEAEAEFRRLIEIAPEFAWAHGYLAKTLLAQGKFEQALAAARLESDEANRLDVLPIVLQAAGRKSEADEALKALTAKFADSDAYYVATNYAYRGDHDLAMQWLERAYQHRDAGLVEIVGEHLFKDMASDPRFKAYLRRLNFPE